MIEFFKEQFSRYGIPDTLVKDNGLQFTSHEFHQFPRDWEFLRVSSFPHHHKANGEVESAVKVAKSLIKKAFKDSNDPWVALLGQRNTVTDSRNKPNSRVDVSQHQNPYYPELPIYCTPRFQEILRKDEFEETKSYVVP